MIIVIVGYGYMYVLINL